MGQALYRKYRSRSFDEVIGQDHVVKTLKNALKSGRISHAYLFSGPRGVGKTTVARVLAHEVNDLDYKDESIHLDIIEIDAASNRRIDEIRELRERVHIAPTSAKYKVYIIDEVHMLTREAFNALLKTLEEPPAHCIFILATTEAHKLPETIISRTQHFNFKSIEQKPATAHLRSIAKQEKIDITLGAIELLAEHGSGSFRDSISLLDQLSGLGGKIDEQKVQNLLGLPPNSMVEKILSNIEDGHSRAVLESLNELKEQGVNFAIVARVMGRQLRTRLADGHSEAWAVKLLRRLSTVAGSADPQERLEIDALEAANANNRAERTTPIREAETQPLEDTSIEPESGSDEDPQEVTPPKTSSPKLVTSGKFSLEQWPEVVAKVKIEAASIYTALRLAIPQLSGDSLTLAFQFPLHQKKLNQTRNIQLIGDIIEELSGKRLKIRCVVDKSLKPVVTDSPSLAAVESNTLPDSLQTINNIFGAAEMLES